MHRDIVVIGASAGGVKALSALVKKLPHNLPAAVFVVLHVSPVYPSVLPEILAKAGKLPAMHARDGQPIERGWIYVAPPNRHMLVGRDRVSVVFGPRINFSRPAINPLFLSAARMYGPRVLGILLTGMMEDGCDGLTEIATNGGCIVVQDPNEAEFPELPENALRRTPVRDILNLSEIAALIQSEMARDLTPEQEQRSMLNERHEEQFTGLTCPECGGPISEQSEPLQFRCVVGHSYSPETMRLEHGRKLENTVWSAIATFDEHARLLQELARKAGGNGTGESSSELDEKSKKLERYATELRSFLERVHPPGFE